MRRTQRHPCRPSRRLEGARSRLKNKTLDSRRCSHYVLIDRNEERPCPLPSNPPRPRAEMASLAASRIARRGKDDAWKLIMGSGPCGAASRKNFWSVQPPIQSQAFDISMFSRRILGRKRKEMHCFRNFFGAVAELFGNNWKRSEQIEGRRLVLPAPGSLPPALAMTTVVPSKRDTV